MPRFRPMALKGCLCFVICFHKECKTWLSNILFQIVLQGSIVGPVLVNLSPSDDAPSAFCLVSISNNEVTSKEK